jgi:hypothetical protein
VHAPGSAADVAPAVTRARQAQSAPGVPGLHTPTTTPPPTHLQARATLSSSSTGSWTPRWAGSPTASPAARHLRPGTRGWTSGWATRAPTPRCCPWVRGRRLAPPPRSCSAAAAARQVYLLESTCLQGRPGGPPAPAAALRKRPRGSSSGSSSSSSSSAHSACRPRLPRRPGALWVRLLGLLNERAGGTGCDRAGALVGGLRDG